MARRVRSNQKSRLQQEADSLKRRLVIEALAKHGGSKAKAAKELGVTRQAVYNLCTRLGL